MPAVIKSDKVAKKRKSDGLPNGSSTTKRRAVSGANADFTKRIESLEAQIAESRKHLNNVATLLNLFKGEAEVEKYNHVVAVSLCRVFSRLMAAGNMSGFNKASDQEKVVISWLMDKYGDYKRLLAAMISEGPSNIHVRPDQSMAYERLLISH